MIFANTLRRLARRGSCRVWLWASRLRSDLDSELILRDQLRWFLQDLCDRVHRWGMVQTTQSGMIGITRSELAGLTFALAILAFAFSARAEFPADILGSIGGLYLLGFAFIVYTGLDRHQTNHKE